MDFSKKGKKKVSFTFNVLEKNKKKKKIYLSDFRNILVRFLCSIVSKQLSCSKRTTVIVLSAHKYIIFFSINCV